MVFAGGKGVLKGEKSLFVAVDCLAVQSQRKAGVAASRDGDRGFVGGKGGFGWGGKGQFSAGDAGGFSSQVAQQGGGFSSFVGGVISVAALMFIALGCRDGLSAKLIR